MRVRNRKRFLLLLPIFFLFGLFSLSYGLLPAAGQEGPADEGLTTDGSQAAGQIYLPLLFGAPPLPEGTLENGGLVTGPQGVSVGAPAGSLAAPVQVLFASASPTVTLPAPAQALGSYIHISASETTYLSPGNPLVLAFPVPSGADTGHLALARLRSGAEIPDVYTDERAWNFYEGLYDSAENLFLTSAAALTAEGETYVLVEHPGYVSPLNPKVAPARAAGLSSTFVVKCANFPAGSSDCTPTLEGLAAALLTGFENRLQGELNFGPPRLLNLLEQINLQPVSAATGGYTAYIEPGNAGECQKLNAGGYYDPEAARLVLCLNPARGIDEEYTKILLHEYFHATQFGYDEVLQDRGSSRQFDFIIEGMAKATEESYYTNAMKRSLVGGSWVELHKIDSPLTYETALEAYFAQDFWVWYGQTYGQYLPYFQNILSRGAHVRDAVEALGAGEYLETYFPWVKNQVIEATNTLDGALTSPCAIEADLVEIDHIQNFKWNEPETWRYDVTVEGLNTKVVEVHFDYNYDIAAGVVFPTNFDPTGRADMALEFKFYKEGESGCESVPEGFRNYENVTTSDTYYVVISNKHISENWDYTVFFEVAPIPGK